MRTLKLICLLALILAPTVFAIDLPPAPDGFSWQEIPEIKAAFLKPSGWYFKEEKQHDTLAYFITKENIDQNGEFQTGLTINVFRQLKKSSAVEQGRSMIDNMAAKYHADKWSQQVGPFIEFGCLARFTDSGGSSVTHDLTVANPKTNTLYLFIFESTPEHWDEAWKIGNKIMNTLALDDEI